MTAKESFESLVFNYAPVDDREFRGHLLRFAAQLCQEQRELCLIEWNSMKSGKLSELIFNAPMPEL